MNDFSLIQILLIVAFVAAFVGTVRRGRSGAISRTEMLGWSLLWIGAAAVTLRPDLASRFAALVGVGRGADAVLYAAVVGLFYLLFRVYLRIDKLERDISTLVRRDALEAHRTDKGDKA
jgi:hypothetical protein